MLTHNIRFLKMVLYTSNFSHLAVFWHRLVKTKKYNLKIHITQLLTQSRKILKLTSQPDLKTDNHVDQLR